MNIWCFYLYEKVTITYNYTDFFSDFFTETSKPKLVFNYLKIENEYKAYLIIN